MRKHEETLQIQVARYISLQWPKVLFTSDASGLKLPIGLAMKVKRQRCQRWKIPDLLILHPSNGYHGLCMELKNSLDDVFTKKGELRQDQHIIAQSEAIKHLQDLNYKALFVCGFDHARQTLKEYFNEK